MSVTIEDQDLGAMTAYGYAKQGGYTGTPQQFATLMASYGTVAQEVADTAAQIDTAVSEGLSDIETKKQEALADIPSDYTTLSGEVTQLKSDFVDVTGAESIPFVDGKYVYNDTGKVYINDIRTSSTGYKYAIVECVEGGVFTVSGTSAANNPIAWAFIQSDGTIITRENMSVTVVDKVVTAPANTAYLVINAKGDAKSYKGELTVNAINDINSKIEEIASRQVSINKMDIDSDLTKHYKLWQNGSLADSGASHYFVSQPIPINYGDVIRRNVTSASGIQFGAFVKSDGTAESPATISTNADSWTATRSGYISVNFPPSRLQDAMVTINEELPETFVPYYDYLRLGDGVHLNEGQVNDLLKTGSALSGKPIAYNGDSICESRVDQGTASNGGAYAKMIADTVGGTYENRAISGGILASAVPSGSLPTRCVVTDVTNMTDNAELICFEGGYNDYARDVPLGEITAESDLTGTLDTTTICGALESIFRQAIVKWLGKPICFVIVHKVQNSYYTANTAGYTFKDVHDKIVDICHKYAIPYYDACLESGLNGHNSAQSAEYLTSNATGDPDGTHPNEAGYERYYVPQLIALFETIMPRS